MKRRRIFLIFVLIGIGFLIVAPILGYLLDKTNLYYRSPVRIEEDSSTDVNKAFALQFSLKSNQKVRISFSVYYANITATLKIFGKGYYEQQSVLNSSPTGMGGLSFVYSQFVWGQEPSSFTNDATSRSITYNGYWYIEFAGSTNNDYLISIPGTYVVVVYGDNDGPPSILDVFFNISVDIDGPGDVLERVFYYIGAGLIFIAILFVSIGYYKSFKGGR
ncbi:MAG: hypothetical protein ACFFD7_07440 [Candidatus Thorarchaeota archaeon]